MKRFRLEKGKQIKLTGLLLVIIPVLIVIIGFVVMYANNGKLNIKIFRITPILLPAIYGFFYLSLDTIVHYKVNSLTLVSAGLKEITILPQSILSYRFENNKLIKKRKDYVIIRTSKEEIKFMLAMLDKCDRHKFIKLLDHIIELNTNKNV